MKPQSPGCGHGVRNVGGALVEVSKGAPTGPSEYGVEPSLSDVGGSQVADLCPSSVG